MTTQPNLFDVTENMERDKTLAAQLDAEIAQLQARIEKGEAWLMANAVHVKRAENEKLYYTLIMERDSKIVLKDNRASLRSCVLQLPPGVLCNDQNVLRILFNGLAAAKDEITLEQFSDYMETIGWVADASKG